MEPRIYIEKNGAFRVPDLAELYSRTYGAPQEQWRTVCAVDKASHILELVGSRRATIESVLEVGCGTGDVLKQIGSANFGTTRAGLEIGKSIRAESHVAEGIQFSGYDGITIPFEDNRFDFVYATHVLEHVPHPRLFISEMRRVSKRLVFLEVPCEIHVRSNVRSLQESLNIGHINFYTPESFALTLETSGLRILKLEVYDHGFAVYKFHSSTLKAAARRATRRLLLRASKHLATRVFAYHCAAICEIGEPLRL